MTSQFSNLEAVQSFLTSANGDTTNHVKVGMLGGRKLMEKKGDPTFTMNQLVKRIEKLATEVDPSDNNVRDQLKSIVKDAKILDAATSKDLTNNPLKNFIRSVTSKLGLLLYNRNHAYNKIESMGTKEPETSNSPPTTLPNTKETPRYNLYNEQWFHNEQLGWYMSLLGEKYPQLLTTDVRFLHKIDTIEGTILKNLDKIEKNQSEKKENPKITILAYPLHVSGNHWTLVYIDLINKRVEYYDSKKNHGGEKIVKGLQEITQTLSDRSKEKYIFESMIKESVQPDGYQCGPWILFILEKLLASDPDSTVNINNLVETEKPDMQEYRSKVVKIMNDESEKRILAMRIRNQANAAKT